MAKQLITGCTLEDRTIEWTTLRDQAPQEPEQVQFESVEVAVPDDVERIDFDAPEASDAVKRACKSMKGTLALALPAEVALLRVADFPTTDPEELDGMVDIYVDQFAPFPMDQVMVSWEYLAQQEESARVLVVAVRLSYVESLGGLFKRAGFLPHQMDVDLLGWWRLLNDEGKISESGRHILIIATAECVNLVVAQDGAPILFRSLGGLGGRASDSVAAEVAEELDYTLTAVEADRGGVSAAEVTIWHRGAEPTEMKSAVEAGSGLKASTERLETLPPLCEGIARRAADGAERRMDLTPTEWHEEEKARATKQKLMGASAVFLLLWMLVMAGLYIGPAYRLRSIGKMRIKVTNLKAPAEEAKQIEAKEQGRHDTDSNNDRTTCEA